MSKKIQYIMPVDWVAGSLSGRQSITYDGGAAYDVQDSTLTTADNYKPIIVARFLQKRESRSYQVRTRSSIHLTDPARMNLAVLGGAGAIYAALIRRGDHVSRAITFPRLMDMLRMRASSIQSEGLTIDNPWIVATPNVSIPQNVLTKFNILS